MVHFDSEALMNPLVQNIEISGIRKFYNIIQKKGEFISLTIGEPDFGTPNHIKEAAIKAIQNDCTRYTHNAGIPALRDAVSNYLNKKYQLNYNSADEIIVTTGASESIDVALRAILQPGDEVVIPVPTYPGYEPIVQICGATPIWLDTRTSGFKVQADCLKDVITSKTKCLILPSPANPTGVSLNADELQAIAEVIKQHNILVVADEIYSEIIYGKQHHSIATFAREQTVVINGLSKSHAMTGWRIGFLMAPSNICKHILKVHQYNVTCASSISQYAALEAVTVGFDDAKEMRDAYLKRRDYVYNRLVGMNLETVLPDGAFYFFVKIPERFNMSSFDFCLELVYKLGVAVIPGSAFSKFGEGYFRLSYASSMKDLEEGLNRLEKFLKYEK